MSPQRLRLALNAKSQPIERVGAGLDGHLGPGRQFRALPRGDRSLRLRLAVGAVDSAGARFGNACNGELRRACNPLGLGLTNVEVGLRTGRFGPKTWQHPRNECLALVLTGISDTAAFIGAARGWRMAADTVKSGPTHALAVRSAEGGVAPLAAGGIDGVWEGEQKARIA